MPRRHHRAGCGGADIASTHVKIIALAFVLSLAAFPASAATIQDNQASAHIGENETVEGIAAEVFTDRKSGTTFIDLGHAYPSETFAGVIFRENASAFGDLSGLQGKTVDLSGKIQTYRGHPEIILRSVAQMRAR